MQICFQLKHPSDTRWMCRNILNILFLEYESSQIFVLHWEKFSKINNTFKRVIEILVNVHISSLKCGALIYLMNISIVVSFFHGRYKSMSDFSMCENLVQGILPPATFHPGIFPPGMFPPPTHFSVATL